MNKRFLYDYDSFAIKYDDGITEIHLNPSDLNKWLYQNKAEYTDYFYEGSLLDNFAVWTHRGIAAIYERYLNTWSSDYLIKFYPSHDYMNPVYQEFINSWQKYRTEIAF